ncbi:MAG: alpha/beta fold hydrolase [Gemmatimonadaceae bacterium]
MRNASIGNPANQQAIVPTKEIIYRRFNVITPRSFFTLLAPLALAACQEPSDPLPAPALNARAQQSQVDNVLTIDYAVPHTSTVAANAGESVNLFVRERVRSDVTDRPREAVLMIHGRSVPVLAGMELRYADYDWALWLARSGGFDVFMLDFQGSGRSPRPRMDDPCNAPRAQQTSLLIPNPLEATCPAAYPFTLNTTASDLDELDTVVEYIRKLRGVDKVHLVGSSQASFRIGPYAVRHPDKVASLFFFAPIFNTVFKQTPQPSEPTPMTLTTRADLFTSNSSTTGWSTCEGQREPGIEDVIWSAIMENDELGRTWGPSDGVMRVRQAILSGWNADVAAQLTVPTLIIRGEFDTGLGGRQDVSELYRLVKNDNKLRFTVQCAGHFMNWEKQRWILHQISKEWIKHGRAGGFDRGEFYVTTEGTFIPQ